MVRAARPIPCDRFSLPPQLSLAAASVSLAEAKELVASLVLLDGAPPAVRYLGEWATVRCLIFSDHVHLVEAPLARFEQLVSTLDSASATGGIAELRGHLAAAEGDWVAASRWFSEAAAAQASDHPNWYRLAVSWHALTAKAITGEPIAGSELREPWHWFRSESITVLGWHGAVSTAVALHRLQYRDLAERLVRWARRSDPGGVMVRFEQTLASAGLEVDQNDSSDDDLEAMIDEVLGIADQMDRRQQPV
jgi:hypothetical protein